MFSFNLKKKQNCITLHYHDRLLFGFWQQPKKKYKKKVFAGAQSRIMSLAAAKVINCGCFITTGLGEASVTLRSQPRSLYVLFLCARHGFGYLLRSLLPTDIQMDVLPNSPQTNILLSWERPESETDWEWMETLCFTTKFNRCNQQQGLQRFLLLEHLFTYF